MWVKVRVWDRLCVRVCMGMCVSYSGVEVVKEKRVTVAVDVKLHLPKQE